MSDDRVLPGWKLVSSVKMKTGPGYTLACVLCGEEKNVLSDTLRRKQAGQGNLSCGACALRINALRKRVGEAPAPPVTLDEIEMHRAKWAPRTFRTTEEDREYRDGHTNRDLEEEYRRRLRDG